MISKKTKIVTINVNGLRARELELRTYLENQDCDCVLALCDTRLKRETEIRNFHGYRMIRVDKEETHTAATAGGVALLVPNDWSCVQKSISNGNGFEALAATLHGPARDQPPFKIIVMYNHPGHHISASIFRELKEITFNGQDIGGFIVGDFNCPHASFGSRTTNEYGNSLIQSLQHENLIVFPTPSPTYFSNASGLENVLDLVIADQSGSRLVESCFVEGDLGSDHLPVVARLNFGKQRLPTRELIDLVSWAEEVDRRMEIFIAPDNIPDHIDSINTIFMESKKLNTRSVTQKKRTLPREILLNISLRKSLLKNRRKTSSNLAKLVLTKQYNRINHKIQEQIRNLDEIRTQNLAESVGGAKTTYEMWQMFNRYKNNHRVVEEPEAPLAKPDGYLTSNNEEKCNEFARYLHSVHQTPDDPRFDQDFKREIDSIIASESKVIDKESIPPINLEVFNGLLAESKTKSAPGEDGISYAILKKCSDNTKKVICDLMNRCLEENVFPTHWKKAKVRMVPKPGRDWKQAANYRPISLLPCLGKLLERYVYNRLLIELHQKNYFNKNQAGFTKRRMGHEHLFRLAQGIENGFKERHCTLGIFLDVKAAFDAVWTSGLKYKIKQIGLPLQLKNMLFSFLEERTLNVNVNGIWSERVYLRAGTPQGSILSPILYLIFVNDATDNLDLSKVEPSQYADDIGMWTTHADARVAESTLQREILKLEKWCRQWQVSLHPAKSKLVLFSKCPRHRIQLPNGPSVNVFGEKVTATCEAKFLGITFDARLTWEPHTKQLVAKAYKRLNLLRSISAVSETTPKPEVMKKLYEQTIRSIFEYSDICIINAADCHLRKLQLVQSQAIRIILKTPAYVSIQDLHDLAGLPLIKSHLIECAKTRLSKMEKISPLIKSVILDHKRLAHIKENVSTLDIIYNKAPPH